MYFTHKVLIEQAINLIRIILDLDCETSGLCWIWTSDLTLIRGALWPAELIALGKCLKDFIIPLWSSTTFFICFDLFNHYGFLRSTLSYKRKTKITIKSFD